MEHEAKSGMASKGKVMFMSPSTAPYSYVTAMPEAEKSNSNFGSQLGPKKSSLKQSNYDTRNSGKSSDFKLKVLHTQKDSGKKEDRRDQRLGKVSPLAYNLQDGMTKYVQQAPMTDRRHHNAGHEQLVSVE